MLTAKGEEIDRVLGLELGADDYIVKPFSPREVVARIKAVLRRTGEFAQNRDGVLRFVGLDISLANYHVKVAGETVAFTPKEVEISTSWLLIRVRLWIGANSFPGLGLRLFW